MNLTAFIQGFYNPSSDNMIPDTINVYLRYAIPPYALAGFARSELNISGEGAFSFLDQGFENNNYYIVIKHRNSIETWSNSAILFPFNNLTYDFSTAQNKAYCNNQVKVNNFPDKFALYSGDVNQDGYINLIDLISVYNDLSNFIIGYVSTDINGDNVVDLTDLLITSNNSSNFVSKVSP